MVIFLQRNFRMFMYYQNYNNIMIKEHAFERLSVSIHRKICKSQKWKGWGKMLKCRKEATLIQLHKKSSSDNLVKKSVITVIPMFLVIIIPPLGYQIHYFKIEIQSQLSLFFLQFSVNRSSELLSHLKISNVFCVLWLFRQRLHLDNRIHKKRMKMGGSGNF